MRPLYFLSLFLLLQCVSYGQCRLKVRNILTNKESVLTCGRSLRITRSREIVPLDRDLENWKLWRVEGDSIVIRKAGSHVTRAFHRDEILSINFRKRKGILQGMGAFTSLAGGAFLVLLSPFMGIEAKAPYHFGRAAVVFGVGAGVVTFVLLDQRGRDEGSWVLVK